MGLTLGGFLLGGRFGRDGEGPIRGRDIGITVDDRPVSQARRLLVLATTLDRLVLGPGRSGTRARTGMRFTSIAHPPVRLLRSAAGALRLAAGDAAPDIYVSGGAERLTLGLDSAFTLDGELFEPEPRGAASGDRAGPGRLRQALRGAGAAGKPAPPDRPGERRPGSGAGAGRRRGGQAAPWRGDRRGAVLRQLSSPAGRAGAGEEVRIVDLYLLADRYAGVHRSRLARALNALPPNVYYLEAPFEGRLVRAKYALVTLGQLERLVSRRTLQALLLGALRPADGDPLGPRPGGRARVAGRARRGRHDMLGETLPLMPGRLDFGRAVAASVRPDLSDRAACRARRPGGAALSRFRRTLRPGDADPAADARWLAPGQGPRRSAAGAGGAFWASSCRCCACSRRASPSRAAPPIWSGRSAAIRGSSSSSRPGNSAIRSWPRACSPGGSTAPAAFAENVRRGRRAPCRPAPRRRARPPPWRSGRRPRRSGPGCAPPTRCSGAGRRHWGCRAAAPD